MPKTQRVHREWFRAVAKTTCDCGEKKTTVWSWGEYVVGKWRNVQRICDQCFASQAVPRLLAHAKECGCAFELVGCRGALPLPPWLTLQDRDPTSIEMMGVCL